MLMSLYVELAIDAAGSALPVYHQLGCWLLTTMVYSLNSNYLQKWTAIIYAAPGRKGRPTQGRKGTLRGCNTAATNAWRWLLPLLLSFCSCSEAQSPGRAGSSAPLALVEQALLTTAQRDFGGRENIYEAAVEWSRNRLYNTSYGAPYIVCSSFPKGALTHLESRLSSRYVRKLAVGVELGACFLATAASPEVATAVYDELSSFGLATIFAPYPSALKLAPGLLDHSLDNATTTAIDDSGAPLVTTHGTKMRMDNVRGLSVELSPGVLPTHHANTESYVSSLWDNLASDSINIWNTNFWSDPAMSWGEHLDMQECSLLWREWAKAADVVHELSESTGRTPGNVCGWDRVRIHHAGDDTLIFTGMDHLLASGKGPEVSGSADLHIACFMGLVSYLSSRSEVLRIAPYHRTQLLNAVAKSITHSATTDTSKTKFTAAGLDGTGEVIQVIDSGVDQESCFFRDSDGETVEGGYYFDEIVLVQSDYVPLFESGGLYPVDLDRRKIVQYISLVRRDEGDDQPYGSYFTTPDGDKIPWYTAEGFSSDTAGGHGSHTAGTAAGSTITSPMPLEDCSGDDELGCLGGCLNTSYMDKLLSNSFVDFDVFCPKFNCDDLGEGQPTCLSDDVGETLSANGGIAPGAKLAIFDVSVDGILVLAELAHDGLWEAANGTGSMVHSNSWGGENDCTVDAISIKFDTYMYENPEHLLLFAVGNNMDLSITGCTVVTPAVAKNVLAVGASSSGETRWTSTSDDGGFYETSDQGLSDIDTVAFFSSRGSTSDNRIKPDIVAPGDRVVSVSSSGENGESCRLDVQLGTSMATPVVAGAAAMIRQYFRDEAFYATDVDARGLCGTNGTSTPFVCSPFDPSAATVKAMLINSANLMGGSSEPDGSRGFGRVHLEAGLSLEGLGDTGLFVADSSNAGVSQEAVDTYIFETADGDSGEFRATLAWIDPPAMTFSAVQLMHDLDLSVSSPSGKTYTMWSSGETDTSNVVERVIVSAGEFDLEEAGNWTVSVTANALSTESQPYSLVVTGPFGNGTIVDDSMAVSMHPVGAPVTSVFWGGVAVVSALLAASRL